LLLREALHADSKYEIAEENLMAAYFNCGVELYNKQRYAEALPLLNEAVRLGEKVGSTSELEKMCSIQRRCEQGRQPEKASTQARADGTQFAVTAP
jgi:hypothetical protein